jgi:hypothetical protein
MSELPGDSPLCKITIPGTHYSGSFAAIDGFYEEFEEVVDWGDRQETNIVTNFIPNPLKSQQKNFTQQLLDGIRYFDLHGYATTFYNGNSRIGFCNQDDHYNLFFEDALSEFKTFLNNHDEETIIVVVRRDSGYDDEFQKAWNKVYGIHGEFVSTTGVKKTFRWYNGTDHCPTLSKVRGKLVLFSSKRPVLETFGQNQVIPE